MQRQHQTSCRSCSETCFPTTSISLSVLLSVAPVPALLPTAQTAYGVPLELCMDGLARQAPSNTEPLNTALPHSYSQISVSLFSQLLTALELTKKKQTTKAPTFPTVTEFKTPFQMVQLATVFKNR